MSDRSFHEASHLQTIQLSETTNEYESEINGRNFNDFLSFALKCRDNSKIEEALLVLRALIVKGSQIYNSDISINLALVYFQMGHIMLEQVEKCAADQESAGSNSDAGSQAQVKSEQIPQRTHSKVSVSSFFSVEAIICHKITNHDHFDSESPIKTQEHSAVQSASNCELDSESQKEEIETLQVAWENLEFARLSISKYLDEQQNLLQSDRKLFLSHLSNCHLRMGDCESRREEFASALEEYTTALKFLLMSEDSNSERRQAELYFLIGNMLFYQRMYHEAIRNYLKGKRVIEELLVRPQSDKTDRTNDCREELKFISKSFDFRMKAAHALKSKMEHLAARKKAIRKGSGGKGKSSSFVTK